MFRRLFQHACFVFLILAHVTLAGLSPARAQSNSNAAAAAAPTPPYKGYTEPEYKETSTQSLYLTMRDGVKIAVDVVLPKVLHAGARIPTIVEQTRYWRARKGQKPNDYQLFFTSHGYAVVWVDVRGTGASTGIWTMPWARDEIKDGGEVVEWIIRQPWSNGKVGAMGNSYGGNAALLSAVPNHPALKAVIPRHYEFDEYNDVPFPGGILNNWMVKAWNEGNHQLDLNRGVRPVDADADESLLGEAIRSHAKNIELYDAAQRVTYRDDRPFSDVSVDDFSAHSYAREIERSGVAINSWGGWLDAGTADAVIKSFMTLKNPQRALVGAWNHGGSQNASPYLSPTSEGVRRQLEWLRFFDYYLKGVDTGVMPQGRTLLYYTMGEERWKETKTWPVAGTAPVRWYMEADHALAQNAPTIPTGSDDYAVDFDATTGEKNRWLTQLGGAVVYPDRAAEDRRLLTYTSSPLTEDTEITGYPIINLYVASTATDGAFFVYLEDVDEGGRVTYLTEGELRALHRKVSKEQPPHWLGVPFHTFKRKDGAPLVPGEVAELKFGLLPTSVLVKKGHRLRVAIAGHDKSVFQRVPAEGSPVITLQRNKRRASFIELPIVRRSPTSGAPVNLLTAPVGSAARATAQAAPAVSAQPAATTPTVAQVLDRYVKSIGGRAAIERVTSRVMKGVKKNPDGSEVSIESYEKIPNKTLLIVKTPDGLMISGFDGKSGWLQSPGKTAHAVETPERARAPRVMRLHREARLDEVYAKMTLKGQARVGEREAYLIEATTGDGETQKLYFDTATGLLVRRDSRARIVSRRSGSGYEQSSVEDVEIYYDDYREIDGIKLPYTVREKTPAGISITSYEQISHNVIISDEKFEMPTAR